MRAAVLNGYGEDLEIVEVTSPDVGPNDVRVRIEASGVCHSDLLVQQGVVPFPTPVILGHEGTGTVTEIGDRVARVSVGDRVIGAFIPACGDCWYCLHGSSNLCEGLADAMLSSRGTTGQGADLFGMSGLGTFAEEMVLDQGMVVSVRSDLPAEHLALIGCGVTTGVGAALNAARVEPGTTVAVFGCGGVGQAVVQGARIAGASRIVAVDLLDHKRRSAIELGATDAVDPAAGDPVVQISELTGGRGVDYAFEAIGRPDVINQAYSSARKGGTIVVIGMAPIDDTVTFSAVELMANDKHLTGCMYGSANVRRDFQRFVDLAESGRLDLDAMVTRRIRLDDVNDALGAVDRGDVIRSVICEF